MSLQVGGVDHHGFLLAVLGSQSRHHLREDALVAPPLPTIVVRLAGAVCGRSIALPQAVTI